MENNEPIVKAIIKGENVYCGSCNKKICKLESEKIKVKCLHKSTERGYCKTINEIEI